MNAAKEMQKVWFPMHSMTFCNVAHHNEVINKLRHLLNLTSTPNQGTWYGPPGKTLCLAPNFGAKYSNLEKPLLFPSC